MKVAVPTRIDLVDDHSGNCQVFSVFTIDENNTMDGMELVPSPEGCGCKSDIASVLKEKGVSVMLAGNMGAGALNVLANQGITVYRGCSGNVVKLVQDFLAGNITDSGEGCNHHEDGHECNHGK